MAAFSQRVIVPDEIVHPTSMLALDENIMADHLEQFLEAEDNKQRNFVFSSPLSSGHVYCFAPSAILNRNYWTLVTMGMSGTRMNVPSDIDHPERLAHAEVMCYLPANYTFPLALGGPIDELSWPIEMLRSLIQYVGTTHCWLGESHGIPNLYSDPAGEPFCAGTRLANMILLDPVAEAENFSPIPVGNNVVNLYLVVPLTPAEAAWKREVGAARSIYYVVGSKAEGGDSVMIDYVIDVNRPCAVDDLNGRAAVAEWIARTANDDEEDDESDFGSEGDADEVADLDESSEERNDEDPSA